MQKEEVFIPCSPGQQVMLKAYLDELDLNSSIPELFWLPVPEELLSELQTEHLPVCGPYVLALEVMEKGLVLETLVRAQNQMHCGCIAFADDELIQHMLDYLNLILTQKFKV